MTTTTVHNIHCHLQHKMAEKARLCFTERSTLGSKDRSGSSSQKEF
jgi:hypothetical protein